MSPLFFRRARRARPEIPNLAAIQRVLEEAGAEFTNGDQPGVRLRAKESRSLPSSISCPVLWRPGIIGCLATRIRKMAQLVYIYQGGIAELSDGTNRRITYDHLPRTRHWLNGSGVSITAQPRGEMWPYALTHEQTGESVSAKAC